MRCFYLPFCNLMYCGLYVFWNISILIRSETFRHSHLISNTPIWKIIHRMNKTPFCFHTLTTIINVSHISTRSYTSHYSITPLTCVLGPKIWRYHMSLNNPGNCYWGWNPQMKFLLLESWSGAKGFPKKDFFAFSYCAVHSRFFFVDETKYTWRTF